MLATIAKVVFIYGTSLVFWKLFRRFFVKTPLDNIPGPNPESFWKGIFPQVFNFNGWDFHKEMAEKYGPVIKIKALFGENQLYVFDPKAMHHIVVKDQYIYEETSSFIEGNKIMFGPGLLGTLGDHHRKQRKMLNPVFSIAHMREMIPIFYNVVHKLEAAFAISVQNGPQEIEVLSWMTRTALELIGQSGLGYSFDPLTHDAVPHPYVTTVKNLGPKTFRVIFPRTYLLAPFVKVTTPAMRRTLSRWVPWKIIHELRSATDTLHDISVEIFRIKRQALAEGDEAVQRQVGQGKDILSILLKANMEATDGDKLGEEELLGQVSTLTFAATETTSSAISRILFLLAERQDVQDKLREEIREARKEHGGDLDYDALVALPYLDAVCRETLRLYSPVSMVVRTTRQDIVLPLSQPIKGLDGREMSEIPIPNNTNVIVGIMAANRNPEIWGPDAHEWKPERWLSILPNSVASAHLPGVYSHLMTFLGGGRACIGFKFSQLEMKVVLLLLLDAFRFRPSDKKIFWQMSGITTPILENDSSRYPQLPMIVERTK